MTTAYSLAQRSLGEEAVGPRFRAGASSHNAGGSAQRQAPQSGRERTYIPGRGGLPVCNSLALQGAPVPPAPPALGRRSVAADASQQHNAAKQGGAVRDNVAKRGHIGFVRDARADSMAAPEQEIDPEMRRMLEDSEPAPPGLDDETAAPGGKSATTSQSLSDSAVVSNVSGRGLGEMRGMALAAPHAADGVRAGSEPKTTFSSWPAPQPPPPPPRSCPRALRPPPASAMLPFAQLPQQHSQTPEPPAGVLLAASQRNGYTRATSASPRITSDGMLPQIGTASIALPSGLLPSGDLDLLGGSDLDADLNAH